jgi:hypothetical protein
MVRDSIFFSLAIPPGVHVQSIICLDPIQARIPVQLAGLLEEQPCDEVNDFTLPLVASCTMGYASPSKKLINQDKY